MLHILSNPHVCLHLNNWTLANSEDKYDAISSRPAVLDILKLFVILLVLLNEEDKDKALFNVVYLKQTTQAL